MTSSNGHQPPAEPDPRLDGIDAEVTPEVLAAIDLWHANAEGEPMPSLVRERAARSMRSAMAEVAASAADSQQGEWAERQQGSHRRWLKPLVVGIVGGAAVLAAAMVASSTTNDSERRDAFIARNADTIVSTLRMPAQPAAHCGNVAWSPNKDEIYVFAANMPANDPEQQRYTLWADTEAGTIELARFDVTNPIDEIVRLRGVPEAEDAVRFRITLDAIEPGAGPASVEIATSDAF
ncbi:MAG: hypothetical protein HRU13_05675 [Phycisphaerales bacterium]|nr:hypothetical protein [Phycisphaerales bacterium]